MKRIEQVLAPPQVILPLSDSPLIPNETMAAERRVIAHRIHVQGATRPRESNTVRV
jgi:hypothetical protein